MNIHTSDMSSVYDQRTQGMITGSNITMRRAAGPGGSKMASADTRLKIDGHRSLLMDSILSRDEARDVVNMLDMADELDGVRSLPGFYTSTQMGKREPMYRLSSPPLSPVPFTDSADIRNDNTTQRGPKQGESKGTRDQLKRDELYQSILFDGNIYKLLEDEGTDNQPSSCDNDNRASQTCRGAATLPDPDTAGVNDRGAGVNDRGEAGGDGPADPVTQRQADATTTEPADGTDDEEDKSCKTCTSASRRSSPRIRTS